MIGKSAYKEDEASIRLNGDLAQVALRGSRLIRFILEQAAVNLAKGVIRTSKQLGLSGDSWPEEVSFAGTALEILEEETHSIWPVVGIRMDYLIASQAQLLRRHLFGELEKKIKRKPDHHFNEGFAPHNSQTGNIAPNPFQGEVRAWKDR